LWKEQGRPGVNKEYRYDALGRIVEVRAGGEVSERYSYGKNGELLTVLDNTQRLQVQYTYNDAGREVKRTCGNGVTQETTYDQAGRTILIRELNAGNAPSPRVQ
jgi:YD repeat-containing protein